MGAFAKGKSVNDSNLYRYSQSCTHTHTHTQERSQCVELLKYCAYDTLTPTYKRFVSLCLSLSLSLTFSLPLALSLSLPSIEPCLLTCTLFVYTTEFCILSTHRGRTRCLYPISRAGNPLQRCRSRFTYLPARP